MKSTTALAISILFVMAILMVASVWNDTATFDELAHIPSGFGYITQLDARLNPEHPPLLKAIAAASAWFASHPHFPTDIPSWRDEINGQWDQGRIFLYESGNNADRIIFWARVPVMLLALTFGWLFFRWTTTRFGAAAALLALTFFAFSPTILAHGRYVTTDLAAAFGFFIGIITFLKFLEKPSWQNAVYAGVIFGAVQLLKFSLVLLIPLFILLIIIWILTYPNQSQRERLHKGLLLIGKSYVIGLIGLAVVWLAYTLVVWNYPQERQLRDTAATLSNHPVPALVKANLLLVQNRFTRPLGHYVFGVLMAQQRGASGNTSFFLGNVSAEGSRMYFPLLYLLKEPLALHLLTLLALVALSLTSYSWLCGKLSLQHIRNLVRNHFIEFSALAFIALYWVVSIASPLNIGIRHVMPTFPFIYLLVARGVTQWMRGFRRILIAGGLIASFIGSTLWTFPHFLSFYNILGGGLTSGFRVAVDSNYDWGQDLKRLAHVMETRAIEKIALDYFGGGNPRYYLGEKFEPWWSARGPAHGWFAISATVRQGAFETPGAGFISKQEDSYDWLQPFRPVATAGTSIFIYYLP